MVIFSFNNIKALRTQIGKFNMMMSYHNHACRNFRPDNNRTPYFADLSDTEIQVFRLLNETDLSYIFNVN